MMNAIKSTRILCGAEPVSGYLCFEDGKITAITQEAPPNAEVLDAGDSWVAPGFIDIHTHGGGGNSFAGSVEEVVAGCNFHLQHGTTSVCPTVSAAYFADMERSAENIDKAMSHPARKSHILGVHMEGPYLSLAQTGAQGAEFITPPVESDYLPLLRKMGKSIARWSYAPENDKDCAFAKALQEYGVVAAAGHTDALYEDIKAAMKHGCRLITHLYSCTSTVTRDHGFRRLGVIESAWLEDDLFVEIIADGKHLPKDLLRLIYKIKGRDRIILVTDSLSLAGTEATHGFMQSTEYVIEDGVCKLMDRSAFAGSIATADRLVRVMVQEAGVSVADAVYMMTQTPARVMGLQNKGRLAVGFDADIVVFDDDISVQKVFVDGHLVNLAAENTIE